MDRSATPVFRVEMDFQFNPPVINRFDVSLSPENQSLLGITARLWDIYNDESAHEALRAVRPIFALDADELDTLFFDPDADTPQPMNVEGVQRGHDQDDGGCWPAG
jgi:hypothetical protein